MIEDNLEFLLPMCTYYKKPIVRAIFENLDLDEDCITFNGTKIPAINITKSTPLAISVILIR